MRTAVLDVGSNSAHLVVADLTPGLPPLRVGSMKTTIRLAEETGADGAISDRGRARLVAAVRQAAATASGHRAEETFAYATAAVRDAANRGDLLAEVRAATGVELTVLNERREAQLTFVAARRWFGWAAGPMTVADIGGGSVEIAYGCGQFPDSLVSVPLGPGRLTRGRLRADRPGRRQSAALADHARTVLEAATMRFADRQAGRAVATSKTFRQLARLCGAPGKRAGIYAPRHLARDRLAAWVPVLARMSPHERARQPGIKPSRARQALAGAVVADAVMDVLGIERFDICPWALREGLLLTRLDALVHRRCAFDGCGAG